MKKKLLWLIPIIIVLLLYQFIFNSSYKPTIEAMATMREGILEDGYVSFIPPDADQIGIIIYPGGKVSYEAYAPFAKDLSEQGYATFVVEMPLDLAIFGSDNASKVIESNPTITEWYILGHSLGGVMAAEYAYENDIKGLVLLASYPQDKHDFKDKDIKVLSIIGSNDGLVDKNTFNQSKMIMPLDAMYKTIPGGNHAQMGSYGKQKNDLDATITEEEQRYQVIETIVKWLND
ncbi:alpha/beta hydrolase [Acidaminobacter sp. JC074]|uniref:alpha/beta hydrolase n=1 Tax=Acidaminobacter sp. JC074 TaxID=2530199 RepID=UPI001F10372B|nr:alpha/beta hydrolase [Acidaminobacter sp. JC074]MCH4888566.1 alpha/beta hydrolase [Acidaminobacter sp. JC074]